MNYPQRKHPRLKYYDYSQNGCYFVTICVKDRSPLLGNITGGEFPAVQLSQLGEIAEHYIKRISVCYSSVALENYVIMPNHIHLLLLIDDTIEHGGMRASRPTLHTIIRTLKTMITREVGYPIWQASYYEEIVRNDDAYQRIQEYIDANPFTWANDDYFTN